MDPYLQKLFKLQLPDGVILTAAASQAFETTDLTELSRIRNLPTRVIHEHQAELSRALSNLKKPKVSDLWLEYTKLFFAKWPELPLPTNRIKATSIFRLMLREFEARKIMSMMEGFIINSKSPDWCSLSRLYANRQELAKKW